MIEKITSGLRVSIDTNDCMAEMSELLWRGQGGDYDFILPGNIKNKFADPYWTGSSLKFSGINYLRLTDSQDEFFRSFSKQGAVFSIDCFFRTGSKIANPHFLLANCAHGNPVDGSGFAFYFYNFVTSSLRFSVQNTFNTPLTRAVHCTHPVDLEPNRMYYAAVTVDSVNGLGHLVLDEVVERFDATYIEPSDKPSDYPVHIGAPGNVEYNVGVQINKHVSEIDYKIDSYDELMQIPYGRMRFNPDFELYGLNVYDRCLTEDELSNNRLYYRQQYIHSFGAVSDKVLSIKNKVGGNSVVVYGAGEHTHDLLSAGVLDDFNVVAFADQDTKKIGSTLLGKKIISPDKILDFAEHVIISTKFFEVEVTKKLSEIYSTQLVIHCLYT